MMVMSCLSSVHIKEVVIISQKSTTQLKILGFYKIEKKKCTWQLISDGLGGPYDLISSIIVLVRSGWQVMQAHLK